MNTYEVWTGGAVFSGFGPANLTIEAERVDFDAVTRRIEFIVIDQVIDSIEADLVVRWRLARSSLDEVKR